MRDPEISIVSNQVLGIGYLTARVDGVDLYLHQPVVAPKMVSERVLSKCAQTLVVSRPDVYIASLCNGTRLFTIFRSVRRRCAYVVSGRDGDCHASQSLSCRHVPCHNGNDEHGGPLHVR